MQVWSYWRSVAFLKHLCKVAATVLAVCCWNCCVVRLSLILHPVPPQLSRKRALFLKFRSRVWHGKTGLWCDATYSYVCLPASLCLLLKGKSFQCLVSPNRYSDNKAWTSELESIHISGRELRLASGGHVFSAESNGNFLAWTICWRIVRAH